MMTTTRARMVVIAHVLAGLAMVSCGGGKPAAKPVAPAPVARKPAKKPKPRPPEPPPKPVLTAETVQLELLETLGSWSTAQIEGKADAYLDLYDEMSFKAVSPGKRGKQPVELDFATWRDARAAKLTGPANVLAERPLIETWLDAGSGLEQGVSQVTFIERYENKADKSATHGTKILRFKREDSGKQRIVYEETVSSEKAFRAKKEKVTAWQVDGSVLPSPITLALVAITVGPEDADPPRQRVFLELRSGELLRVINLDTDSGGCAASEDVTGQLGGMRCWWAGGGMNFRVTRQKDVLVVERQYTDEQMKGKPVWLAHANVTVVKDAVVTAEGAAADKEPEDVPPKEPPVVEPEPVLKPEKEAPVKVAPKGVPPEKKPANPPVG
jgi:hypothetical protein